MAAPALSSKLVILQQNPSQSSAYMKESDGKVVLVATEQMLLNYTTDKHNMNGSIHSIASNTSDEDLTSLTWLHDTNLLRGNVSNHFNLFIRRKNTPKIETVCSNALLYLIV